MIVRMTMGYRFECPVCGWARQSRMYSMGFTDKVVAHLRVHSLTSRELFSFGAQSSTDQPKVICEFYRETAR